MLVEWWWLWWKIQFMFSNIKHQLILMFPFFSFFVCIWRSTRCTVKLQLRIIYSITLSSREFWNMVPRTMRTNSEEIENRATSLLLSTLNIPAENIQIWKRETKIIVIHYTWENKIMFHICVRIVWKLISQNLVKYSHFSQILIVAPIYSQLLLKFPSYLWTCAF